MDALGGCVYDAEKEAAMIELTEIVAGLAMSGRDDDG